MVIVNKKRYHVSDLDVVEFGWFKMCAHRESSCLEARITVCGENPLQLGAAAECGSMLEILFEKTA